MSTKPTRQEQLKALVNKVSTNFPSAELTQCALEGRDKKQPCYGCGRRLKIDELRYVTPNALTMAPEFYCADCISEFGCVDLFAPKNY